ncbi:small ribosomal subunit protein uS17m-like [Clavelina lepadiformis]|uniref:Mitochondrial ribosomal protein S17 n=1 Tax=Clavelina lepadiformis TaxID=159417 RepID=A0ABP0GU06_CLALP
MERHLFTSLRMAIGKVTATEVSERARVLVQLNRFNKHLGMYFPENEPVTSYNPDNQAKVGDVVLIKKMPETRCNMETHQVEEVIYSFGFIVDPMTGLRVKGDEYLTEPVVDEETRKAMSDAIRSREIVPKYSFEIDSKDKLMI